MRKLLVLTALATALFAGLLPAVEAPKNGPPSPRKAPEFVFKMPDGSQHLLSTYRGKTVVLALMFTTCPHCQKTAQLLTKIQSEYAAKGVQMLGAVFDQGAASRAVQFEKQLGLNFPIGSSEQGPVLEFLGLPPNDPYFVPALVFIDKRGTIRGQYVGDETFLDKQEINIRAEIEKMLKTAGPATPTSRTASPAPPKS
jgi:peroxiredoxin